MFSDLEDKKYKNLLLKECSFRLKIEEKVLKNVEKTYYKQKETGVVRKAHCNYSLLEKSMRTWEKIHNL